jgi:hypothetical protein
MKRLVSAPGLYLAVGLTGLALIGDMKALGLAAILIACATLTEVFRAQG